MSHDFSYQNLQGKSFENQDLKGTNFSNANIRSVNFNKTILTGANFSNTRAGQQYQWIIFLIASSLLLATVGGFVLGYSSGTIGSLIVRINKPTILLSSTVSLIILVIFIIVTIRQGIRSTLGTYAITISVAVSIVIAAGEAEAVVGPIIQSVAVAGAIAGVIVEAVALTTVYMINTTQSSFFAAVLAIITSILGALEALELETLSGGYKVFALSITTILILVLLGFSIYITWKVITKGDKKYLLIQTLAIIISSLGGTSFRSCDLTDADFTFSSLKSVDFRQANITRTCWFQAKYLEQARVEGTYLELPLVRQLVTTKDGQDKNFNHLNLRYLNLKDAKLQNASFISTDLSEATLHSSNLFNAKLAQAQLYRANLTNACLTGAYIENWGISINTQLDKVKCDYVYMRLPTPDDPDPWRKPDNRREIFQQEDFTDFIAPVIKTLDLYQSQNIDPREVGRKFKTLDLFHHGGIDPTAAAIAITQLAENNPEAELELVMLEGRGQEKIRLQAMVAGNANPSKLNNEYFEKYSAIKSLSYSDLKVLLVEVAGKDERIRSLEKLLADAVQQPKFYAQTYQLQGDFIMSQSKGNVNISGAQGDISGVNAVGENSSMTGVAIGAISGNVTNTINQLEDSLLPDKPGIKELLTQLQEAIEADTNLSKEDKKEALEQVNTLAEAGKNPQEGTMQKGAKTAIKILKGTISGLPSVATLVESCNKLLPLISNSLGLG